MQIIIDPRRLQTVQSASMRERAALTAANERLANALTAQDRANRDTRRMQNARLAGQALDATEVEAVTTTAQRADTEIVDASYEVEIAKERVSAASRLRNVCEDFVTRLTAPGVTAAQTIPDTIAATWEGLTDGR